MQAGHVSGDIGSETAHETLPDGVHQEAAAAFVDRARSQHEEELVALYVFGSTVRDDARRCRHRGQRVTNSHATSTVIRLTD